jgi:hypothetical protein
MGRNRRRPKEVRTLAKLGSLLGLTRLTSALDESSHFAKKRYRIRYLNQTNWRLLLISMVLLVLLTAGMMCILLWAHHVND